MKDFIELPISGSSEHMLVAVSAIAFLEPIAINRTRVVYNIVLLDSGVNSYMDVEMSKNAIKALIQYAQEER